VAPDAVNVHGLVPRERYVSREFAALELDRLWSRVWQVAARVEELAEPGDHVEYRIGDQSVLVVRGEDGGVRAFHNACLHRGTRLANGRGCFEGGVVRCRYHGWQYALDGTLVGVPDREQFADLPDDLTLTPVRCDTWGGFVFVNLDPDADALLEFLDPIPRLLAPYHLEQMRLRAVLTTELPANWKVVVDAFNEAYHVQGTHPQILPWTDDVSIEYEQLGRHARYGRLPGARRELRSSPRVSADEQPDEGEILAGLVSGLGGAFLKEEQALVDELRTAALAPGELLPEYQRRRRDLLAARGLDVSGLELEQMTSAEDFYVFPNVVGPIYPGSAILFRARPAGLEPGRAIHDTWVLDWPSPDREPRPPRRIEVPDWRDHDWGEITSQDYANMAEVQAGMQSQGFPGLRLNPVQEANIAHMHRTIDEYLQR
jgi:nitrite reductase/ring-hydroxylating ferredoxin subunit